MKKLELEAVIREQTGVDKATVGKVVDSMLQNISNALKGGDSVIIAGFGKFAVAERAERTARNPQTGETVTVAAKKAVKFTPAKPLKDSVNGEG